MNDEPTKKPLRSQAWFGRQDKMGFYYRSFLKNSGTPQDRFEGRPVIGICNTWSELTPCNGHFRTLAEHVRAGVLDAGGYPLEFPVSSLGEVTMRPTAMMFRNLAAMDVEEAIRAHPLDGVVLLMGCDKTTPALLMGAGPADLPTLGVSGGPQLREVYRGQMIGSGTNIISISEQLRAGETSISSSAARGRRCPATTTEINGGRERGQSTLPGRLSGRADHLRRIGRARSPRAE